MHEGGKFSMFKLTILDGAPKTHAHLAWILGVTEQKIILLHELKIDHI
jgi:hypothetical protein